MMDDESLFDAWCGGDLRAGNELFRRHFRAIQRFFDNKVAHEAEELVQRTFMRCVDGRAQFGGRSSFRTFLFGVARNVLLDHFRRHYRRSAIDVDDRSVVDLGVSPWSALMGRRTQRIILEALRRIPLKYQTVLELYYWEQLSGDQLSEILNVSENTARSRVRLAKQHFERALRRLEVSPTVLRSTMDDLEGWASRVKDELSPSL